MGQLVSAVVQDRPIVCADRIENSYQLVRRMNTVVAALMDPMTSAAALTLGRSVRLAVGYLMMFY